MFLRQFPSESVDLLVTDPPYGLRYMGRDWDKAVPSTEIWKECLRVLKSGAFGFVMSSPRLDCLEEMSKRLREAGFRIDFTPIAWCYASGFPKAENIAKAAQKKVLGVPQGGPNPLSPNTGKYKGGCSDHNPKGQGFGAGPGSYMKEKGQRYVLALTDSSARNLDGAYAGFQPKVAWEIIIVAMKPLSQGSYLDQALKDKKGVTWLKDGRIPFQDDADAEQAHTNSLGPVDRAKTGKRIYEGGKSTIHVDTFSEKGRFAPNLLVSDDALNDGQEHASGKMQVDSRLEPPHYHEYSGKRDESETYGDRGSFSRYFSLDAWWTERIKNLPESVQRTFPFLICPKASKTERNEGLDDLPEHLLARSTGAQGSVKRGKNHYMPPEHIGYNKPSKTRNLHPTVKPLKLMSYLVTLGSREGDVVLDPFAGTGTTCIAAHLLNRKWIGIEIEPEYVDIARARLKPYVTQQKLKLT